MAADVRAPAPDPGAATSTDGAGPSTARLWRIIVLAIFGLLTGVAIAGLAALLLTVSVGQVTDQALRNDIELEDEADDFRVGVLDVRHFHRNLIFTGPTRVGLEDFDRAVAGLFEELDELALVSLDLPEDQRPVALRARVEEYVAGYRPAVALYATDRAAFDAASDVGLARLAALQEQGERLDALGEELAEAALQDVERATSSATLILVAILLGVGAAGLALAIAAIRVLRELRTLDRAQREAATALGVALRTKTDFIADASHELRTPLTVLRGNAEVGLAAGPSDCGHEPVLREIVRESGRMTKLVEDLLFLARYDAGSLPLELQTVDLEPWLADMAGRAEVLARQRGASVVTALTAEGIGRLDPARLEQAVLILVDNAATFSPAGVPVRLASRVAGPELVVEVADQGPGIEPEMVERVFERFHRGDRTRRRREGGAGLGLAIGRAIVDAHGGRIEVDSRVGSGTAMRIVVPLTAPAQPAMPEGHGRTPPGGHG